jgi:hypothetical protein
MENNYQDLTGKSNDHQENRAKDEIPSWLEGLVEPDAKGKTLKDEETIQTEVSWVRGIDEDKTEPSNQREKEEQTRVNHVGGSSVDDQVDQSKQDDFVEISDLVLNNSDGTRHSPEEEALSEDEELPEWLNEMIAEEPDVHSEEIMPGSIEENEEENIEQNTAEETLEKEKKTDEPTEPFDITQETPVGQEEAAVELPTKAAEDEEPTPEPDIDLSPVPMAPEEKKGLKSETPKMLRFAALLLEQGDYNQATDILQTFINKPEFRREIKKWITNAINNGAENNSAVWEILGDIALSEGDSVEALNAYTKAIDILLGKTKGSHEID